jgi:hypothetical protein
LLGGFRLGISFIEDYQFVAACWDFDFLDSEIFYFGPDHVDSTLVGGV